MKKPKDVAETTARRNRTRRFNRPRLDTYIEDNDYDVLTKNGTLDAKEVIRDVARRAANALVLRYFDNVPCGMWQFAEDGNEYYELSGDEVARLGARQTDIVVNTKGASMVGLGIPESAIILMRPVGRDGEVARPGQICLMETMTAEDQSVGMIKKWMGEDDKGTDLRDGKNKRVALPNAANKAFPRAKLLGIVAWAVPQ